MSIDLTLYLVTDSGIAAAAGHELVDVARAAAAGGATAVQIREKHASSREFLDTVLRIDDALPAHVALLVNDRVDVFLAALGVGAGRGRVTGMHIGQGDLPAMSVRELIGPDAILGVSASTPEQLRRAAESPALVDYVGIGAVHATTTKADAPAPLGLGRLAELVTASTLPAVGIGGVSVADLPEMRATGAAGAAVVSAICGAADPEAAARGLRAAWEAAS